MTDAQILQFWYGMEDAPYCDEPRVIEFARALLAAQYQFFGVWGPTGESLYVRTTGTAE